MGENTKIKNHWSFWLIGGLALFWNAMGCLNFIAQMNAEKVAAMPEAYQAVIGSRPIWATLAFAIAVFGGALGSLLLLLKKSVATTVFIASLIGVIATMLHALSANSPNIDFTPVIIGTSMSLIVAVFLIWYAKWAKSKNWVR